MKVSSAVGLLAVAVACCFLGEPAFGQGRGIGRSVSQSARNGVHGQQLAAQIQQLQAAQGIGQVNAGGKNAGVGGGMMGGGQGQGPGMMGGGQGKGGPPAGKGPGMMGGGQGKGGPPAGKGKPF